MKKVYATTIVALCFIVCCDGQTKKPENKLSPEFLSFFAGSWSGDGEFASGKKISADVSFSISLDSAWITYQHTDRQPNRYKSISMWGIDMNGQFVAYAFDNFKGHRKFVSEGWREGKLILTNNEFNPQWGLVFQHFIYEKVSDDSFRMTYETSKDGISWKLGDYLIFKKK